MTGVHRLGRSTGIALGSREGEVMNNVARGGFRPFAIRGLSFLLLISPYSAIPLSDFFRLHLTITSIVLVPVDHRLDKTIYLITLSSR